MGSVWTMGVICHLHGIPNNSILSDLPPLYRFLREKAGSFGRSLRRSCLISAHIVALLCLFLTETQFIDVTGRFLFVFLANLHMLPGGPVPNSVH